MCVSGSCLIIIIFVIYFMLQEFDYNKYFRLNLKHSVHDYLTPLLYISTKDTGIF